MAHKSISGTVSTDVAHLVAVALSYGSGADTGSYPIVVDEPGGSTITGTTLVDASSITITPTEATDVFLNAQINMSGNATIQQPKFKLFVDNGGYDGLEHYRKIGDATTVGSGSLVGIATGLTATDYVYSVRHASDGTNILTTSNVVLVGFQLSSTTGTSVSLPIDLLSFDSEVKNDRVNLLWSTASEVNNDYFNIERSDNGKDWRTISETDGAGNSSQMMNYQIFDNSPISGKAYYRLKQTDFDG